MSDIKEFVENIIQHMVDKPEEVRITEKEGEHADAIRTIVRAVSAKQGKRCTIEINE